MMYSDEHVAVQKLNLGPYDNCVYIVHCLATGHGIVIDAAAESERILAATEGIEIQEILETHGHHDHIGALDPVIEALDVPWRMHPDDVAIAGRAPDSPLRHGQEIAVGDLMIHALHTPGHTPGSMTFVLEPIAFTGDTLFPGGPGATRWDYSSFGQIMDSIEQHLLPLPDATLVCPGHGSITDLGTERPAVPDWRRRGW